MRNDTLFTRRPSIGPPLVQEAGGIAGRMNDDDPDRHRHAAAAAGLPDLLAPGLSVVFCGINPGQRALASGHHFDGRGNRFWRVMHLAGFTPELMSPAQDRLLLARGWGLTTVVDRGTARASELAAQEFFAAAGGFVRKIRAFRPERLAFLGKAAYAAMTGQTQIAWGPQATRFVDTETWILPNPSGLNRAFSLDDLVLAYRAVRDAARSTEAVETQATRNPNETLQP
jgi:TDG/mug DNA glycosylase family protein